MPNIYFNNITPLRMNVCFMLFPLSYAGLPDWVQNYIIALALSHNHGAKC